MRTSTPTATPRSRRVVTPVFLLIACLAGPASLLAQTNFLDDLVFEQLVTGLLRPVAITHAGDGSDRLFITLQDGQIVIYDGEKVLDLPFLDITSRVSCCGERGLLSVAFHPDLENNGFFYVDYTDRSEHPGDVIISRFTVSEDPNIADPDSEKVILRVDQPNDTHNGGQLQFGPNDGFLYIGLGDGGDHSLPVNPAREVSSLLGAILRVDVDRGDPYAIPGTNPLFGQEGVRQEIWVYGLRNPWRFSFDRLTGDLFIGDVGQGRREEIDFQPANSLGLENYGWDVLEGSLCFDPVFNCDTFGLEAPILEYSHDIGCAVAAGYRYRGAAIPELNGVFLYGDYCSGVLFAASDNNGQWTVLDTLETGFSITAFGEDEQGEIYLTDYPGQAIYRITNRQSAPEVTSFQPRQAVAGGAQFDLLILGSNFGAGVEARWRGETRPSTVIDTNRLRVTVWEQDLAAEGTAEITVVNSRLQGSVPARFDFPINPAPNLSPRINPGGVVNAATFAATRLAPGVIASVFGIDLAVETEELIATPLPTTLGGTTLFFDGTLKVPLYYASPNQVNIQIPWELAGEEQAELSVRIGSEISQPVVVPLAQYSPAIFTVPDVRPGQGAILIANTSGALAAPLGLSANSRPVRRGEILEIFAVGLGPVTFPPASGSAAPRFPHSETITEPRVTIGGVPARLLFTGLAPTLVGLYQINARRPDEAPSGDDVVVKIIIEGLESNPVTIAVE